jgi:hypothetical protein
MKYRKKTKNYALEFRVFTVLEAYRYSIQKTLIFP